MQSLWSKAGQAHRCGCRACSTAVGGLGRRVTSAPKRKPTFAELFTACYSSVFAAGALVDAIGKDERRRDLDRQLDEARRDLAELKERSLPVPLTLEPYVKELSDGQMDTLWQSLQQIYITRPFMKEIDRPALLSADALRERLQDEHYRVPATTIVNGRRPTNLELLERAMIAEEHDASIQRRHPKNQAQLRRDSLRIEYLIGQMMARAHSRSRDSKPCPTYDQVQDLLLRGYPRYTFRDIDRKGAGHNTSKLNQSLRDILYASHLGLKEKIGRVCYNMLVSAHSPDMHSYNALIVAFDKIGYHQFSEAVVYSFFHESRLTPTPCTHAAVLYHYKTTNNHGRFLRTLSGICGLDQKTGGLVRRRHADELDQCLHIARWATDTRKRTLSGDYVWEHVPLNRVLVEEVMSGLLHFKLVDQAVYFLTACLHSGVSLTTNIIKQVLDECVVSLDWRASTRLIRELANHQRMWTTLIKSRDSETVAYFIDRIYSLLDLAGIGVSGHGLGDEGLDRLDIWGEDLADFLLDLTRSNLALPEALSIYPERGSLELRNSTRSARSRLLQLESIAKECIRVCQTSKSIESKLLQLEYSDDFRESITMHIGDAALESSSRLDTEFTEILQERITQSEDVQDREWQVFNDLQRETDKTEQRANSLAATSKAREVHHLALRPGGNKSRILDALIWARSAEEESPWNERRTEHRF